LLTKFLGIPSLLVRIKAINPSFIHCNKPSWLMMIEFDSEVYLDIIIFGVYLAASFLKLVYYAAVFLFFQETANLS
jgi:uncharacterized membrane protein